MKKCGNLCHVFKDDPVTKYRSKIAYDVIWEFPKQRSKSVDDHVSPTNIEHPRIMKICEYVCIIFYIN